MSAIRRELSHDCIAFTRLALQAFTINDSHITTAVLDKTCLPQLSCCTCDCGSPRTKQLSEHILCGRKVWRT